MGRNRRSNPLALAVLCCLYEEPMHPYQVAQTLRSRAKHDSVKLNYGALYGVVAGLERRGLLHARETVREGRRPERTVYEITDAGVAELNEWLSELVAVPEKEYLRFEAALSFLPALPPRDALALLVRRADAIAVRLAQSSAARGTAEQDMPRLFALEAEYTEALLEAELGFVRSLIADLESATLAGLELWQSFHDGEGP